MTSSLFEKIKSEWKAKYLWAGPTDGCWSVCSWQGGVRSRVAFLRLKLCSPLTVKIIFILVSSYKGRLYTPILSPDYSWSNYLSQRLFDLVRWWLFAVRVLNKYYSRLVWNIDTDINWNFIEVIIDQKCNSRLSLVFSSFTAFIEDLNFYSYPKKIDFYFSFS